MTHLSTSIDSHTHATETMSLIRSVSSLTRPIHFARWTPDSIPPTLRQTQPHYTVLSAHARAHAKTHTPTE